jgi:hypothetical protein
MFASTLVMFYKEGGDAREQAKRMLQLFLTSIAKEASLLMAESFRDIVRTIGFNLYSVDADRGQPNLSDSSQKQLLHIILTELVKLAPVHPNFRLCSATLKDSLFYAASMYQLTEAATFEASLKDRAQTLGRPRNCPKLYVTIGGPPAVREFEPELQEARVLVTEANVLSYPVPQLIDHIPTATGEDSKSNGSDDTIISSGRQGIVSFRFGVKNVVIRCPALFKLRLLDGKSNPNLRMDAITLLSGPGGILAVRKDSLFGLGECREKSSSFVYFDKRHLAQGLDKLYTPLIVFPSHGSAWHFFEQESPLNTILIGSGVVLRQDQPKLWQPSLLPRILPLPTVIHDLPRRLALAKQLHGAGMTEDFIDFCTRLISCAMDADDEVDEDLLSNIIGAWESLGNGEMDFNDFFEVAGHQVDPSDARCSFEDLHRRMYKHKKAVLDVLRCEQHGNQHDVDLLVFIGVKAKGLQDRDFTPRLPEVDESMSHLVRLLDGRLADAVFDRNPLCRVAGAKDVDFGLIYHGSMARQLDSPILSWISLCVLSPLDAPVRDYYIAAFLSSLCPRVPSIQWNTQLHQQVIAHSLAEVCPVPAVAKSLQVIFALPSPLDKYFRHVGGVFGIYICDPTAHDTLLRTLKVPMRTVDAIACQQRGITSADQLYKEIISFFENSILIVYVRGLAKIEDRLLKWCAEYTKASGYRFIYFEGTNIGQNFSENRDRCNTTLYSALSLEEMEVLAANKQVSSSTSILEVHFADVEPDFQPTIPMESTCKEGQWKRAMREWLGMDGDHEASTKQPLSAFVIFR